MILQPNLTGKITSELRKAWQLLASVVNGHINFDEGYGGGNIAMPVGWVAGDILRGRGANQVARLGIGTGGQILTSDGTNPYWASGIPSTLNFVYGEVPVDSGDHQHFTLAHTPSPTSSLALYLDGLRQLVGVGNDYILTGATIILSSAWVGSFNLIADYQW